MCKMQFDKNTRNLRVRVILYIFRPPVVYGPLCARLHMKKGRIEAMTIFQDGSTDSMGKAKG